MTRTELVKIAHTHDSSIVRSRAAGLVVALDELELLMAGGAAYLQEEAAAERARLRRKAAMRAERYPTPPPIAKT